MFMQTGFKNALFDSTVQILQDLNADLVLIAKARYALPANQTFTISRIYQARGVRRGSGGISALHRAAAGRLEAARRPRLPDPRVGLRPERPGAADSRGGALRRAR